MSRPNVIKSPKDCLRWLSTDLVCGWCKKPFTTSYPQAKWCSTRCGWQANSAVRALRKRSSNQRFSFRDIVAAHGTTCNECHLPVDMTLPGTDPLGPCTDHVIPLSRGGPHVISNCRVVHVKCNRAKSDEHQGIKAERYASRGLSEKAKVSIAGLDFT